MMKHPAGTDHCGGGGGAGEEEEEEDAAILPPVEWLPDRHELHHAIFAFLDPKTVITAIPRVSKRWRAAAFTLPAANLDLRWFGGTIPPGVVERLGRQFARATSIRFKREHEVTDGAMASLAESCPEITFVEFRIQM